MRFNFTSTLTGIFLLFSVFSSAQSVGINSTGATPDNSALLDLKADDKGFLMTRVDTSSIVSPAFGLMTYAPLDSCLYLYNGIKWTGMGGGGVNCSCNCYTAPPPVISPCTNSTTTIVEVVNPLTGKTWMDRNLGADQAATSSTDILSFGDLYQWGRCSDGHEKRTSGNTATVSSTETPNHADFILSPPPLYDWLSPGNSNLWQGVNGVNNPCPTGYRLPTKTEYDDEILTWSSSNAAGALASPLKLPLAGSRNIQTGNLEAINSHGYYWTSTSAYNIDSYNLWFKIATNSAFVHTNVRGYGKSIRCIKD